MKIPQEHLRKLTKEEINEMPLRAWEGPVDLVRTQKELDMAVPELRAEPILGFDTETRPSFKKGVTYKPSLIQLATATKVFLFQLTRLPLEDGLKDVLADPGLTKTGVSVRDDVRELQAVWPFKDAGFVDLGEVAKDVNMQTFGLRNLAANLLGFRISKRMQCSNWGHKKLSQKQIRYAATDAWVSREIHLRMAEFGALPQE